MSDSLDRRFASLRAVANSRSLAGPAALRRTATHRTNVRRATVVGFCAVVVAAVIGLMSTLGNGQSVSPANPSPSPVVVSPPPASPPPVTATPPTAAPPSTSTSAVEARIDCRPEHLDPRPHYGLDAGSGQAANTVVIHNRSATPCRVKGFPTLVYTDAAGKIKPIPLVPWTGLTPGTVSLAPGGWAQFSISHANNYGGYQPGSPECSTPHDYRGVSVSVELAGGTRFPLPGFGLTWRCADAHVNPWIPSEEPELSPPNMVRAP